MQNPRFSMSPASYGHRSESIAHAPTQRRRETRKGFRRRRICVRRCDGWFGAASKATHSSSISPVMDRRSSTFQAMRLTATQRLSVLSTSRRKGSSLTMSSTRLLSGHSALASSYTPSSILATAARSSTCPMSARWPGDDCDRHWWWWRLHRSTMTQVEAITLRSMASRIGGGFFQWKDHTPKSGAVKGTSGGLAICISGCNDSQSAQDTQALSGSAMTGAMIYSLIYAVEIDPGTTYGRLLSNMRSVIRGADAFVGFSGPVASFMKRMLSYGIKQEPQLSSSEMFDIYRKPFLL